MNNLSIESTTLTTVHTKPKRRSMASGLQIVLVATVLVLLFIAAAYGVRSL